MGSGGAVSSSSSSSGAIWNSVRFSNCRCRRGRPVNGVNAPGPDASVEKVAAAERVLRWEIRGASSFSIVSVVDAIDDDGERYGMRGR